jgi:hypothetical protein
MNRYHRFLNISNYIPNIDTLNINTENLKWAEFHKSLQFSELNNPKIEPWLNSMGMTSRWIEFFYTPPKDDGIIHSDNVHWSEWAKLIFQYGAEGSTMRWWSSPFVIPISTSIEEISEEFVPEVSEYKIGDRNNDHYHGMVNVSKEEFSTIEYEAEVGKCSLVNVGPLHSAHNPTNDRRFSITIALFDLKTGDRILWDDALNKLSQYIVDQPI